MTTVERIQTAFRRARRVLSQRPAVGTGTAVTRVRLVSGLTLEVEDGDWRFTVDMPEKAGGEGRGPNAGVYGRGALGACLATSYLVWAAHRDVPIDALEVEVEADYDARGEYGVGGVAPGYREMRYVVNVESPASEATVLAVLDEAEAACPYLWVFRDPQALRRVAKVGSRQGVA